MKIGKQQNIFLVGPMGVGKSVIGKWVARLSKREFVDSDRVIEQRAGVSISWIFDVEGESGFRSREARVIADLVQRDGIVLATGGGCVTTTANRRVLAQQGTVVFLTADISTLCHRVRAQPGTRPLLAQATDLDIRVKSLYEQREPLFAEIADLTLDTSQESPAMIAKSIVRWVDGEMVIDKA